MRTPFVVALLGLALAGASPERADAATAANSKIFLVNNGLNKLTVGKHQILAARAWRENGNAHSFEVVTFYEAADRLNLIPLFSKDKGRDKEDFDLTVSGGADCQLHDFRFVKAEGKQPARLILADRDLGDSYADAATVRFTYYDLVDNPPAEDEIGKPGMYFEARKKTTARQKYCDVNEAFDKELHLGASGTADN